MKRDELSGDFYLTKRGLGSLLILLGLLAILGSFVNDLLGGGRFAGVGPAQRLALLAAGLVMFVGLTLWPLGQRPA